MLLINSTALFKEEAYLLTKNHLRAGYVGETVKLIG